MSDDETKEPKTEKEWQKEAIDWLKSDPRIGDVWQNDSNRNRHRKFGGIGKYRPKGLPDLCGYTSDGRFLAIEFKTHKGVVSDDQSTFIKRVIAFGGRAGVARSIEDLENILLSK
jgi:hypothetical protein